MFVHDVVCSTDICKDSSDDYSDSDSSHTEGYAVMDVIEYELPDDSESDDVSSASSGTDVSLNRFCHPTQKHQASVNLPLGLCDQRSHSGLLLVQRSSE